jgi:hypothetical protein
MRRHIWPVATNFLLGADVSFRRESRRDADIAERAFLTRRRHRLFGIFAVRLDPELYSAGPKSLL